MAFFQQRDILTAIEIGTSKICVLVGEPEENGTVTVIGRGEVELSGTVLKGEIVDMNATSDLLFNAITEAENNSNVNIDSSPIYVAVTGAHINTQQSSGSVLIGSEDRRITGDDVTEAAENAKFISQHPNFSVISYFDSYYLIDGNRKLANPIGHVAHKLDSFVHIILGDPNRIENFKSIINDIGVETHVEPVFSAVASAYGVFEDDEDKDGVLLIEMGAGTTEYILFKNQGVQDSGVIAVGCNHVENDIALGFDIGLPTAVNLLKSGEYVKCKKEGKAFVELNGTIKESHRKLPVASIDKIIDSRMRELFQILYSKLEGKGMLADLSAGIVLSGGGALVPCAEDILYSVFRVPVRVGKPVGINGSTELTSTRYSTVCGLLKCGNVFRIAEIANQQESFWGRVGGAFGQIVTPIKNSISDIISSIKI